MHHYLLYCCRQLNICFGMSNLESDCSDYLPPGLDSLPAITSDFTYYLSCIMHHSSQITVLGTMLTWHPSTGILSWLTACIYIIFLILFQDSGKTLCRRKSNEWELKIIAVGFMGYCVLLAHKCVVVPLLSFPYRAAQEFIAFPSFLNLEKHIKLVPQVDSVSATE